ncbi:hypothetical protein CASFOL_033722 [Castilleja foliolosa]|uniref:Uncharacterized protein n=1 Tax=Castilleja foliolosa TaxID=1961234 RepID=A0ABD3BXT8_9LAMI
MNWNLGSFGSLSPPQTAVAVTHHPSHHRQAPALSRRRLEPSAQSPPATTHRRLTAVRVHEAPVATPFPSPIGVPLFLGGKYFWN